MSYDEYYQASGTKIIGSERAKQICRKLKINYSDVSSYCRKPEIVRQRKTVANILRSEGYSYPSIAKALGHIDHTTAMYWCGLVKKRKR